MERLTDKNHKAIMKCGDYSSCYSCRKEICYISELEQKLGELEDVLESWHIENLEELKTRLHDCQVYHLKNNSNETLIHNLKNELAELKQAQKQLAIEELEKVKKYNRTLSLGGRPYIDIFINNQIKELKGEETI